MVGVRGFEPPTPASRTQYSTRLSYTPNQLFSNTYFCYMQLASPSQARGQQLYAGRDIRAIGNCSETLKIEQKPDRLSRRGDRLVISRHRKYAQL